MLDVKYKNYMVRVLCALFFLSFTGVADSKACRDTSRDTCIIKFKFMALSPSHRPPVPSSSSSSTGTTGKKTPLSVVPVLYR